MSLLSKILSNGFVPLIPILVWNLLFMSKLPQAFSPRTFNSDIPLIVISGERIFRSIIFLMPLFFRISISSSIGKTGFWIFSTGALLYFLSWLMLIYIPDSYWSRSLPGFAAPAITPLVWLVGLGLMADSFYFMVSYSKWYFIIPSMIFSIFHVLHTLLVYREIGVRP